MMQVVVDDSVILVFIFCARSISAQQDAGAAQIGKQAVRDFDTLTMEINTDARAAAGFKYATSDRSIFVVTKPQDGVPFVIHLPVVLQTAVTLLPSVA